MPAFLFTPSPDKDAVRFLKDKAPVSRAVFDGLLPELRPYAFTVAGVENVSILKKLRDRVAQLPAGADWNAIKGDLAQELSPWLGDDAAAGLRRAETLLRTHGYQAYAVTNYKVMQRQTDVFPWWEYDTADDEHVRSTHAALDGKIFPANAEFWKNHFPPWEWGCRCNIIARSADDVAEIETADAKKIPEARRVVKGDRLTLAEKNGVLMAEENGIPRAIDIRSPREKAGGSGYSFDPSVLEVSLDDLKARYVDQPETWQTFETWAKRQALDVGTKDQRPGTVWQWLEGSAKSKITSPKLPIPAAPVVPVPAPLVLRAPVSAAVRPVTTLPALREEVRATLAAIDRVHDDGLLPAVRVDAAPGRSAYGTFFPAQDRIGIMAHGPWPRMTTAHEVGHLLDYHVLGSAKTFASAAHPALQGWREAVHASASITSIVVSLKTARPVYNAAYLLRDREIWARSYAQYIAQKSGDPKMQQQLDIIRGSTQFLQWSDADFAPIAAAIDHVFKDKGWLGENT